MPLVRVFHKYRGVSGLTLKNLVAAAGEMLPAVAPRQSRYKVSLMPDERTVRYYVSRGLVDRPSGKRGTAALYNYRHLLQVLVVKYLQSQYLPLARVAALMHEAGNRDLEHLLPDAARPPQVLRHPGRIGAAVPEAVSARGVSGESRTAEEKGPERTDSDRWHRIEVSPGIELHVHEAALAPGQRERLRAALLAEMGRLRGWTR